jgi:hypothetical protein
MCPNSDGGTASLAALGLILTLAGCAAPPAPRISCPALPAAAAMQEAKNQAFNAGYQAGELAQALRDRARATEAAAALFKSNGDPLLSPPPMPLVPPPPITQVTTSATGPAVPINKGWPGF